MTLIPCLAVAISHLQIASIGRNTSLLKASKTLIFALLIFTSFLPAASFLPALLNGIKVISGGYNVAKGVRAGVRAGYYAGKAINGGREVEQGITAAHKFAQGIPRVRGHDFSIVNYGVASSDAINGGTSGRLGTELTEGIHGQGITTAHNFAQEIPRGIVGHDFPIVNHGSSFDAINGGISGRSGTEAINGGMSGRSGTEAINDGISGTELIEGTHGGSFDAIDGGISGRLGTELTEGIHGQGITTAHNFAQEISRGIVGHDFPIVNHGSSFDAINGGISGRSGTEAINDGISGTELTEGTHGGSFDAIDGGISGQLGTEGANGGGRGGGAVVASTFVGGAGASIGTGVAVQKSSSSSATHAIKSLDLLSYISFLFLLSAGMQCII